MLHDHDYDKANISSLVSNKCQFSPPKSFSTSCNSPTLLMAVILLLNHSKRRNSPTLLRVGILVHNMCNGSVCADAASGNSKHNRQDVKRYLKIHDNERFISILSLERIFYYYNIVQNSVLHSCNHLLTWE